MIKIKIKMRGTRNGDAKINDNPYELSALRTPCYSYGETSDVIVDRKLAHTPLAFREKIIPYFHEYVDSTLFLFLRSKFFFYVQVSHWRKVSKLIRKKLLIVISTRHQSSSTCSRLNLYTFWATFNIQIIKKYLKFFPKSN